MTEKEIEAVNYHPYPAADDAVGDIRAGSTKRVAAAVGEGSAAVRSVHEYLAFAH
jgi:hypothetical protein